MHNILLTSKMVIPRPPSKYIERRHLDDVFVTNIHKRISILRAPAGYGKTTLLSTFFGTTDEKVAWVALDEGDNEPIRFWRYLLASIAKARSGNDEPTQFSFVQPRNEMDMKGVLYNVIEELSAYDEPIHICFDDYHYIKNETIHTFLEQLVEYLPANVHIYMTTRTTPPFPIAKWRVKQWVQEIKLEQFKFSRQEIKQFFLANTHKNLTDEQVQSVLQSTEGWVSGLLLTSLALENNDGHTQGTFITEFLWHEIIHKQSPEVQQFLMETSILHGLAPAICDQLTDRTNSLELLQQLEEKGIFTFKLQASPAVYRYHHLFKDVLQNELMKQYGQERVKDIVKKVAMFYYADDHFMVAIELVMKHEIYDLAINWIDEKIVKIVQSGQTSVFMQWLQQLRDAKQPLNYEMYSFGFTSAVSAMNLTLAQELMEELEAAHQRDGWMDDPQNEAIAQWYIQTKAYYFVALGDRLPEVMALLKGGLGTKDLKTRWDSVELVYNNYEANICRTSIGSRGKHVSVEEALDVVKLFRYTPLKRNTISPYLYAVAAEIFYEANVIEEAEKEMQIILDIAHQKNSPSLYVPMYIMKAKIYIANNQLLSAQAMLQQVMEKTSEKHWKNILKMMQAYCYLIENDLKQAQFLLESTASPQPFWKLIYVKFLIQSNQIEEALHLLIQVKTEATQDGQISTLVQASALEIVCHYQMGQLEVVYNYFQVLFKIAEKYHYVRTFLDDEAFMAIVEELLVDDKIWQWEPDVKEVVLRLKSFNKLLNKKQEIKLTPREKQLLQLIFNGETNKEIANTLHLSEGTVRVYLTTLYSKLGVTSRIQAVLMAQENKDLMQ